MSVSSIGRDQKSPSIPEAMVRHLTLKKIYIQAIRAGSKTVEGRPLTARLKKFQAGDVVRFYYYSNSKDDVRCEITRVETFPSFDAMLTACGVAACVPEQSSHQAALAAYHAIPGYAEKAHKFGVVALHLKCLQAGDI